MRRNKLLVDLLIPYRAQFLAASLSPQLSETAIRYIFQLGSDTVGACLATDRHPIFSRRISSCDTRCSNHFQQNRYTNFEMWIQTGNKLNFLHLSFFCLCFTFEIVIGFIRKVTRCTDLQIYRRNLIKEIFWFVGPKLGEFPNFFFSKCLFLVQTKRFAQHLTVLRVHTNFFGFFVLPWINVQNAPNLTAPKWNGVSFRPW